MKFISGGYGVCSLFIMSSMVLVFLIQSCQPEDGNISYKLKDDEFNLTIIESMGDPTQPGKMALIGNSGYLVDKNTDSTQVLVISNRIEKGLTVPVRPIGVLKVNSNGGTELIIVGITTYDSYNSIDPVDLTHFSIHYGPVKRMIEQWFYSQFSMEKNLSLKWENEKYLDQMELINVTQ